jgi:hypothetical protein
MKQLGPDSEYSILDPNKPDSDDPSNATCWQETIYGVVALLLFYVATYDIRTGLPLVVLWLVLPLIYRQTRNLYDRWYVGRYVGPITLLVSTSEPARGKSLNIVLAQTFRQTLTIESLALELIMHESWRGKDHHVGEEVIRNFSQSDRLVQAGQLYKINVTFLIPHYAKPTKWKPEAEGYDLHWLLRVTLKCKNVDALTKDYPITVTAGASPL